MAFLELSNDIDLADVLLNEYAHCNSIVLSKSIQSGKTLDILTFTEVTYKTSATVFISDKNFSLVQQTNNRAKVRGWEIQDFREAVSTGNPYSCRKTIKDSLGRKKLFHAMMEVHNLDVLHDVLTVIDCPVTLIIDEADKNRNVSAYDKDEKELPVITRMLLKIKNMLIEKDNGSRVIFVTATPQSLLVSEKDPKRLVIYKKPFNNYVGAGLNHTPCVEVIIGVRDNPVKSTERWTNTANDLRNNTYRQGINAGLDKFMEMSSKDESVKQLMLVSLESRNRNQQRIADYIKFIDKDNSMDVIVFNGESEDVTGVLSDSIKRCKKNKIVVVAGFMASRGVSFTDFSDADNKFELCVQVHYTKTEDPLNSSLQAMRIFGPARRTITRPVMICNRICAEDLMHNFTESYRIIKDLALGNNTIMSGIYNSTRPLTQKYNFRYMQQSARRGPVLLLESMAEQNHTLVV